MYFDYNIVHDDLQTGWCYRRKENFTFRWGPRTLPNRASVCLPDASFVELQQHQNGLTFMTTRLGEAVLRFS